MISAPRPGNPAEKAVASKVKGLSPTGIDAMWSVVYYAGSHLRYHTEITEDKHISTEKSDKLWNVIVGLFDKPDLRDVLVAVLMYGFPQNHCLLRGETFDFPEQELRQAITGALNRNRNVSVKEVVAILRDVGVVGPRNVRSKVRALVRKLGRLGLGSS